MFFWSIDPHYHWIDSHCISWIMIYPCNVAIQTVMDNPNLQINVIFVSSDFHGSTSIHIHLSYSFTFLIGGVVWNLFYSSRYDRRILPTDVHTFQRGWNHQVIHFHGISHGFSHLLHIFAWNSPWISRVSQPSSVPGSGRPSSCSCVAWSCGAWRGRTARSNAVPCCRRAAAAWSRTWRQMVSPNLWMIEQYIPIYDILIQLLN